MVVRLLMLSAFLIAPAGSLLSAEEPKLDKKQSKLEFVGSKAEGEHKGGFKEFTADAVVDFENPEQGSLSLVIKTDSLWSDNEKLTNHLKNPDFFDVRKYPAVTFKSTGVVHDEADGKVKIEGVMTMLGKEVKMSVPATVTVSDTEVKLVADFKLDRTKWGMTYGKGQINDEVAVKATLVFTR